MPCPHCASRATKQQPEDRLPFAGRWSEAVDPERVTIPESMRLAVEDRVDRLGPAARERKPILGLLFGR
ncbi:MAG TPA: hypothetical protein VHL09_02440, partial [Dehalococcoidia bacterium]|nr:hypothetical protein [Dehalococcoidia bacterium]